MSRSTFSRRAFLGGAGGLVALPFLESLLGRRRAAADPMQMPKRLVIFKFPQGSPEQVVPGSWKPSGSGAGFQLSPILAALEPVKSSVMVLGGLQNTAGNFNGSMGTQTIHEMGCSSLLNGVACPGAAIGPGGMPYQPVGMTIDQLVANQVGGATPGLKSLQLATRIDNWYSDNVVWTDPNTPLPWTTLASQAFSQVFAGYQAAGQTPDPAATTRVARRKSVLDAVQSGIGRLEGKLSTTDKAKLDQYLTSVRDLETTITAPQSSVQCDPGSSPQDSSDLPTHVKAMMDLIVLAFSCDRTRVVDFSMEGSATDTIYPGTSAGYHNGIVHAHDYAGYVTACTWILSQYAYLVNALANTPEPSNAAQSMLDNTVVVAVSEFGYGDGHWSANLPVVVSGNLNGAFTSGRYVAFGDDDFTNVYAQNQPIANLWLTLAQAFGSDVQSFGDSTGTLKLA